MKTKIEKIPTIDIDKDAPKAFHQIVGVINQLSEAVNLLSASHTEEDEVTCANCGKKLPVYTCDCTPTPHQEGWEEIKREFDTKFDKYGADYALDRLKDTLLEQKAKEVQNLPSNGSEVFLSDVLSILRK